VYERQDLLKVEFHAEDIDHCDMIGQTTIVTFSRERQCFKSSTIARLGDKNTLCLAAFVTDKRKYKKHVLG